MQAATASGGDSDGPAAWGERDGLTAAAVDLNHRRAQRCGRSSH